MDGAYVIGVPRIDVKDRADVEECPVDSSYEGDRMLNIHSDQGVTYGACDPAGPVEAIYEPGEL